MKKFFRIDYHGTPRHVIEAADGGPWRLLEGELFGSYEAGDEVARDAHRAARAGRAVEGGLHRPQLQGSRGRAGQAAAEGAADVHQAVDLGDRPRRHRSCCPTGIGRVDHEAEVGVVIGRTAHHVERSGRARLRARADLLQRRHRARAAAEGRRSTRTPRGSTRSRRSARASPPASTTTRWPASASRAGSTASAGRTRRPSSWCSRSTTWSRSSRRVMTLLPGDVIATGTPSGIGPLKAGDKVTIRIPGVGDLVNPVADEILQGRKS